MGSYITSTWVLTRCMGSCVGPTNCYSFTKMYWLLPRQYHDQEWAFRHQCTNCGSHMQICGAQLTLSTSPRPRFTRRPLRSIYMCILNASTHAREHSACVRIYACCNFGSKENSMDWLLALKSWTGAHP